MTPTPPRTRRTANRQPHLADDVRAIIGEYALKDLLGVVTCRPRDIELVLHPGGNWAWNGNNGKICYPDQAAAVAAADAFNALPGPCSVHAYACPRGGHWHHVDRDRRARSTEALFARIAAAARRAADR